MDQTTCLRLGQRCVKLTLGDGLSRVRPGIKDSAHQSSFFAHGIWVFFARAWPFTRLAHLQSRTELESSWVATPIVRMLDELGFVMMCFWFLISYPYNLDGAISYDLNNISASSSPSWLPSSLSGSSSPRSILCPSRVPKNRSTASGSHWFLSSGAIKFCNFS